MLVSTAHGPLITTRLDMTPDFSNELYDRGEYDPHEIGCARELLSLRRKLYGDGVYAIDCGACFGVHSIEWSRFMMGWGNVLSIEAQERLYYALAGNIALNNCLNVQAIHVAVGNTDGTIRIPKVDYGKPGRYGSVELKQRQGTEFVGQPISYADGDLITVNAARLDSLGIPRVDLVKLDVEGMELETLEGAENLLLTHYPLLIIEIIKSDRNKIAAFLGSFGYTVLPFGRIDVLAVSNKDKSFPQVAARDWSKRS